MPAFDAVTVTLVETVVGKNKCAARSYSLIISFEKFSSSFIFVVLLLAFENCHHHDHPMLFHVVGLFAFEKLSDECIDLS